MNCNNCGVEIKASEPHGYLCKECMDAAIEEQMRIGQEAIDETAKENGDMELSPFEAVMAMLDGEVLTRHKNSAWKKGLEAIWDGADFVARCDDSMEWSRMSSFDNLVRNPKQKSRP